MNREYKSDRPFFTKDEWKDTFRIQRSSGKSDPNALRFKANSKDKPKWIKGLL